MSEALLKRLASGLRRKTGNQQFAKVAIDDVAATIDLIGTMAREVGDQRFEVAKLKCGNFKLIEALMAMVEQFFDASDENGQYDEDGKIFSHRFMSAEERAIAVLVEAGMAEEIEPGKNGYRLREDLLEQMRIERCPPINSEKRGEQ